MCATNEKNPRVIKQYGKPDGKREKKGRSVGGCGKGRCKFTIARGRTTNPSTKIRERGEGKGIG